MIIYKSKKIISSFLFLFSLFSLTASNLVADNHNSPRKTFYISDPHGRDTFRFESEAPLETIVGTTNHIRGEVVLDPNNVAENLKASFEIDLATIDTGIKERNGHLRDQYLETEKYPKAILTIEKIIKLEKEDRETPEKLENSKSSYVTAEGVLELHGIKKRMTFNEVKITYFDGSKELEAGYMYGDILKIDGNFKMKLSDFNIKRPQFLLLKLSEELNIKISMLASTVPPKEDKANENKSDDS